MCLVLELGISSNTELGISLQPHPLTRFGALTLRIHRHWLSSRLPLASPRCPAPSTPATPPLPLRRHGSARPSPAVGGRMGRGAASAVPPRGLRRSSTPSIEGGRAPRRRGPQAAELPPRRRGEARWRPSHGGGSARARPSSSLLAPPHGGHGTRSRASLVARAAASPPQARAPRQKQQQRVAPSLPLNRLLATPPRPGDCARLRRELGGVELADLELRLTELADLEAKKNKYQFYALVHPNRKLI
ncbi:hypothetical protein PVAP13_7NG352024 [Panicum virgatum]|uniref:Uncharacterized protein n=1 Tax=Panicum virgatum TaxID=38727 RepID=A0A8T0Q8Y2_PANVG|nr:hypothetical protein PVAP13_7NG352024 [Panicum virgatum]